MVLIFGGAYQGKLDYAKQTFENRDIVEDFDKWILELVKAEADVAEEVRRFIEKNRDAVVICCDISCGVVPIDPILRKWREAVGRALAAIARQSDEVIRMFCGIPTKIK
ncbi:MAG: bifunctional adenosylcobinamide kinase/adenosylcobinamide-phosphate guanylyltransferase [Oscillospiraceae bacterium]|nr:bifunctional adenosylcobinamide kinase/adenosylcobinamide-phosphate guanylyltransferase [Oscillospiraceae bacterium]